MGHALEIKVQSIRKEGAKERWLEEPWYRRLDETKVEYDEKIILK